jgi:type IV pilus assembly protein PilX
MALVFLLLLTILGIAALNTTSLEEKMAHNVKDRNLAFQAAESALIVAENWIYTQVGKPVFPNNPIGLYTPVTSDTDADPNWKDSTWSTNNVVTYPSTPGLTVSGSLGKIQTQPKYIVEDMGEIPESGGSLVLTSSYKGKGTTVVRITARGTGGTDAAVVMLQSTYSRAF